MIVSMAHLYADDPRFQKPESAYRHAQRRKEQTVEEAYYLADQFVREQFGLAWEAKRAGDINLSLHYFTVGLHTLQDSTSALHGGFSVWTA